MNFRYIARIVIENKTPLFVGSGASELLKDAVVQKDAFGFPMIPGTTLAGILKHSLEPRFVPNDDFKSFFGFQEKNGKKGLGSQLKVSSAYLLVVENKVVDSKSFGHYQKLKSRFDDLPLRQHVRISHRGAIDAKEQGLFDNEVVYKGCRFIFELEMKGTGKASEKDFWKSLLNEFKNPLFRIGQGTRKGYGSIAVKAVFARTFDLTNNEDFDLYLNHNASFNEQKNCLIEKTEDINYEENTTVYTLKLNPDSFFIFSSGYGDETVDNVPLEEEVVTYPEGQMVFQKQTVIPASSIKGAIRHRVCFHYNKKNRIHADLFLTPELFEAKAKKFTSINNVAVNALFGAEEGANFCTEEVPEFPTQKDEAKPKSQRGKIVLDDIYLEQVDNSKVFNHVAIDRFTGGALDGALFSEKVTSNGELEIKIVMEPGNYPDDIKAAFKNALEDICKGLLPLGGMTTKGHGIFTGQLFENENELYNYAKDHQ